MKKQASILLYIFLLGSLVACSLPVSPDPADSSEEIALQYQTVSALLTATALWEPGASPLPSPLAKTPQATPRLETTELPLPAVDEETPVSTLIAGEASEKPLDEQCDQAQAGRPIDVTIPDDMRFYPGEYFSKTWRLVNAGNCRWTRGYSVVWFSGDDLGVIRSQNFSGSIEPGQVVDVTVDMMAPKQPGTYQSNWKVRSEDGHLFGIGPNSDSPFWVRIVVVPVNTPTVTPTIPISTPTRAPVILARGNEELLIDDRLELDLKGEGQEAKEDLMLRDGEAEDLLLVPINGARLVVFGANAPRYEECLAVPVLEEAVRVAPDMTETYFCYRTTEGLPGRLMLSHLDLENSRLSLEFTTWSIP